MKTKKIVLGVLAAYAAVCVAMSAMVILQAPVSGQIITHHKGLLVIDAWATQDDFNLALYSPFDNYEDSNAGIAFSANGISCWSNWF